MTKLDDILTAADAVNLTLTSDTAAKSGLSMLALARDCQEPGRPSPFVVPGGVAIILSGLGLLLLDLSARLAVKEGASKLNGPAN